LQFSYGSGPSIPGKPRIGARIPGAWIQRTSDLRDLIDQVAKAGAGGIRLDLGGAIDPLTLSQTGRREIATAFRSREIPLLALGSGLRKALDEPENHEARLARVQDLAGLAGDLGARALILPSGDPAKPVPAEAVPTVALLSPLLGGEIRLKNPNKDPLLRTNVLEESLAFLASLATRQGLLPLLDPGSFATGLLWDRLQGPGLGPLGLVWDPATQLAAGRRPIAFFSQYPEILTRELFITGKDWLQSQAQEAPPGTGDVDWPELLIRLGTAGFAGFVVAHGSNGLELATYTRALVNLGQA